MKNKTTDIYEMLDTLSLPVAAQRFAELEYSGRFWFFRIFWYKV